MAGKNDKPGRFHAPRRPSDVDEAQSEPTGVDGPEDSAEALFDALQKAKKKSAASRLKEKLARLGGSAESESLLGPRGVLIATILLIGLVAYSAMSYFKIGSPTQPPVASRSKNVKKAPLSPRSSARTRPNPTAARSSQLILPKTIPRSRPQEDLKKFDQSERERQRELFDEPDLTDELDPEEDERDSELSPSDQKKDLDPPPLDPTSEDIEEETTEENLEAAPENEDDLLEEELLEEGEEEVQEIEDF